MGGRTEVCLCFQVWALALGPDSERSQHPDSVAGEEQVRALCGGPDHWQWGKFTEGPQEKYKSRGGVEVTNSKEKKKLKKDRDNRTMVAEEVIITLSGGAPWGFRLQGGVEQQKPLQVAKVSPVTYWLQTVVSWFAESKSKSKTIRLNSFAKEKWNISWDILGRDLRSVIKVEMEYWLLCMLIWGLNESSSCLRTVFMQRHTDDWLTEL